GGANVCPTWAAHFCWGSFLTQPSQVMLARVPWPSLRGDLPRASEKCCVQGLLGSPQVEPRARTLWIAGEGFFQSRATCRHVQMPWPGSGFSRSSLARPRRWLQSELAGGPRRSLEVPVMSAELQCHSDAELLHGSSDDADRPTQRQPLFARKLTHSVVLAVSCGAILALASLGVASHWSGQSGSRASVRIRGATNLDDLGNLVDDVKDAADDAVDEAQDAADDVVEKPPGGDVAEDADEVVDDAQDDADDVAKDADKVVDNKMRMTSPRMRTRLSTMPKMLPMTSRISCRAVSSTTPKKMRMTSPRMRTRLSTMPKMLPMTSRISCRAVMWRRMRTRPSTTLKMMRMTSRRMRTRSSTMPKMLRMTSRRSCRAVMWRRMRTRSSTTPKMMRMTSRMMRTRSSTMPKMLRMTSRISCRTVMWRRMRTRSSTTLKMMRMTSRRMRTRSSTMPKMLRMTSRRSCPVVTPKVMRMTSQRSCWVVTTLRLRRRRRRSCVSTSSSGAGDGSWRSP
ncbi:unnamed protein product, partial [Prorocentrum cordatum]